MATKIYGASDDLIEFEGDLRGEVGCYGTDDRDQGVLLVCSDGTLLEAKYGKDDKGIWGIRVVEKGVLFDRMDPCTDAEANPYSDIVYFKDGLKWAYAATDSWQRVN